MMVPTTLAAWAAQVAREQREERSKTRRGRGPGGRTWTPEMLQYERHEHPIRWDVESQRWVCSDGCGYSREKRPGEICQTAAETRAPTPWLSRSDPAPLHYREEDY